MPPRKRLTSSTAEPRSYSHPEATTPSRPEIGTQAHFRRAKPPSTWSYDSSLSPELHWDGENLSRELAENLIAELSDQALRAVEIARQPATKERDDELHQVADQIRETRRRLAGLSGPFLNWSGKAERLSFDVPALPLFVHERLSTRAILDTLAGHRHDQQQDFLDALFGSRERSLHEQVLKAYEYQDDWVNRLILGDSLVVMNSLLQYEGMAGKAQMIYLDPPYGVKFGSNFQPFVRRRDVSHNEDNDLTREPEMVQAYRDTWELGLHSYLTYLRDRLLVARDLLTDSGSIFVQISDENVHYVREVLDEVFGAENFVSQIAFQTTSGFDTKTLATLGDFLLWYGRDKSRLKCRKTYEEQPIQAGEGNAKWVLLPDGTYRGERRQRDRSSISTGQRLRRGRGRHVVFRAGRSAELRPLQRPGRRGGPHRRGREFHLAGQLRGLRDEALRDGQHAGAPAGQHQGRGSDRIAE